MTEIKDLEQAVNEAKNRVAKYERDLQGKYKKMEAYQLIKEDTGLTKFKLEKLKNNWTSLKLKDLITALNFFK